MKSSLQSISAQELLTLLDSKDYIGSMVANDKYNGQVSFFLDSLALISNRSRRMLRSPTYLTEL